MQIPCHLGNSPIYSARNMFTEPYVCVLSHLYSYCVLEAAQPLAGVTVICIAGLESA